MLGDEFMQWGFINGSPNAQGHTYQLAQYLLDGQSKVDWNLVNYQIAQLGQQRHAKTDEFMDVVSEVSHADALLIGTPIYWSDMTGLLKTFLDRCTMVARQFDFTDIPVYLLVNGTQTPDQTAQGIAPAVSQLCEFLKMNYQDTIYVDTSKVVQPSDYTSALHKQQEQLHTFVNVR